MPSSRALIFLLCILSILLAQAAAAQTVVPLTRAHSHNDYMRTRPLQDALDCGFCSVEADINLVDGKLLVAHELRNAKPERTLQALYLDPLRARIKANGGAVHPGVAEFTLLIDIKTDSAPTYAALHDVLSQYADMLSEVRDGALTRRAVTVLVDNANDLIANQAQRYAFVDGRPADLDANPPALLMPWVSESWGSLFSWKGVPPMPEAERAKLQAFVARAHEQGRKVRFWGLPMRGTAVWEVLYAEGVDLLNADSPTAMRDFLLKKGK